MCRISFAEIQTAIPRFAHPENGPAEHRSEKERNANASEIATVSQPELCLKKNSGQVTLFRAYIVIDYQDMRRHGGASRLCRKMEGEKSHQYLCIM
jgi:hypothetical protein